MGDYLGDISVDPEMDLLGEDDAENSGVDSAANHAFKTAPVFTGDAFEALGHRTLPQRALYGRIISQHSSGLNEACVSPKLYINTNTPFSALICGVQGSGKSHSTSVLLESCLISESRLGTLPAPLSALVFHYDTAAGGGLVQPCEAAYLSTIDSVRGAGTVLPKVVVLVLPTYLRAMKKVYAGMPEVQVEPLLFSPDDISGERLLSMMKVDENTEMPLYMESVMAILRSMEENFDYAEFRKQLASQSFNPGQKAMLNMRLALLDSCINGGNSSNRVSTHFKPGQLTIIDLSSPFMDGGSACSFFDMILGLFVEANISSGKLVVLDEAHKYLSESQGGSSGRLTDSLLTVIRQQRHLATRVVISTQEPTVVPSKYLDLCSFVIAHRFSSPVWLRTLAQHVSAADSSMTELFTKIVSLQTGQAVIFAPNGLTVRNSPAAASANWYAEPEAGLSRSEGTVIPLGLGYFVVRSRYRVTRDGGHSLLAVDDPTLTTRLGRVSGRPEEAAAPAAGASTAAAAVPAGSADPSRLPASGGTATTAHQAATNSNVFTSVTKPTVITKPSAFTGSPVIRKDAAKVSTVPLVNYMRVQYKSGFHAINITTVQKHFRQKEPKAYGGNDAVDRAISLAISAGVLQKVVWDDKKIELTE